MTPAASPYRIDGVQYANWSEEIFKQMREGRLDAVHVTIVYHENFREMVARIEEWNQHFASFPELIFQGLHADDIRLARQTDRTAIFFGFQNPSPIEDDIRLVEICHRLGVRIMQLSYNNQSLLSTGCYEAEDSGITRMGKEVIGEMNRLGMIVDMSHNGERSTLEAIDISARPVIVSHGNPAFWHKARRNKSDEVIRALGQSGGMLGLSLYPHHLKDKSNCKLESFCEMVARAGELAGIENIGLGSDLCTGHSDSTLQWMRTGRWSKHIDYGEGSASEPGFPAMPGWFKDSRDFDTIEQGLGSCGLSASEVAGVMGENWLRFFERAFEPAHAGKHSDNNRESRSLATG